MSPTKANAAAVLKTLRRQLRDCADAADAAFLQRYFKTAPGEYGAGDRFLGVRVPVLRKLSRQYRTLPSTKVQTLLRSRWHEERLLALLILVEKAKKADEPKQRALRDLYLQHTHYINNWDLVDLSAQHLLGPFVEADKLAVVRRLAHSAHWWERRIAIMATLYCIRQDRFQPTLKIANLLLDDTHPLIHKAVGWMLREVGNRDRRTAEEFLKPCYRSLPRTLLRYAIEKYPEPLRQRYLQGKVKNHGNLDTAVRTRDDS